MCASSRWLLGAAALFFVLPIEAQEAVAPSPRDSLASEHFAAASAAFSREDYASALGEFRAAIAAGSLGPAAYYNAAVSEYRLGDFAAAEASFRELARRFPELLALADYNRGLALYRLDRAEAAREAFASSAATGDAELAALSQAMLARLPQAVEPAATGQRWVRLLDLGIGHDDNVALIDPLSLPTGRSTESAFSEFALFAGGPVGAAAAWTLSGNAYLVDYPDAPEYDQRVSMLAARRETHAGHWRIAVGPQYGRSYIGGDGFEEYLGATLEFGRDLTRLEATFELAMGFDSADDLDPGFAYIAGDREVIGLRFDQRLTHGRLLLDYRASSDDRAGAGVSAGRDLFRVTWRRPWAPAWTGDLLFEYRATDFDRIVPNRTEDRVQAGIRAFRPLGSDWQIVLDYRYADNDSNDERFRYERHRAAVGASWMF